jgi:hypothetical protein
VSKDDVVATRKLDCTCRDCTASLEWYCVPCLHHLNRDVETGPWCPGYHEAVMKQTGSSSSRRRSSWRPMTVWRHQIGARWVDDGCHSMTLQLGDIAAASPHCCSSASSLTYTSAHSPPSTTMDLLQLSTISSYFLHIWHTYLQIPDIKLAWHIKNWYLRDKVTLRDRDGPNLPLNVVESWGLDPPWFGFVAPLNKITRSTACADVCNVCIVKACPPPSHPALFSTSANCVRHTNNKPLDHATKSSHPHNDETHAIKDLLLYMNRAYQSDINLHLVIPMQI